MSLDNSKTLHIRIDCYGSRDEIITALKGLLAKDLVNGSSFDGTLDFAIDEDAYFEEAEQSMYCNNCAVLKSSSPHHPQLENDHGLCNDCLNDEEICEHLGIG